MGVEEVGQRRLGQEHPHVLPGLVAVAFIYARDYLRANELHKGEFYVLGLFGLLGMGTGFGMGGGIIASLITAVVGAVALLFAISFITIITSDFCVIRIGVIVPF